MLDRGTARALGKIGFDLRTILYCDSNPYTHEVLKARMRDGAIDEAPIWDDVTTLDATRLRGHVDCVVAGFPCQPFSFAGKRAGIEDERYLFADVLRIAEEARASVLFLENVPGLLGANDESQAPIGDVARLLAEAGFDAVWRTLYAQAAGTPQRRERFFCIAWKRSPELGDDRQVRLLRELSHQSEAAEQANLPADTTLDREG